MATRIQDLELAAQPIARYLVERSGSIKRVMSAGVIALGQMTADERETFFAAAGGAPLPEKPLVPMQKQLDEILQEVRRASLQRKPRIRRAKGEGR